MSDREKHLEALLSEGLDLCVRARKMDAMDRRSDTLAASASPSEWQKSGNFARHVQRHNINFPHAPLATKSGTVHLWLQEQYDKDLADWEQRARDFMLGRRATA